ncbi:cell division protein FtsQ/DivIB [Bacillaceae bacterium W0354]
MAEKKVISIEDRIPQLKQKRKRKANRRFFTYLTIILLLIILIVYLQSPLSYLQSIEVTNHHSVSEEEIIELSQLSTDESFWSIKVDQVIENIKTHPEIEEVTIKRKWYNHIVIEVSELKRVGYVNNGNNYYPILENGKILNNTPLKQPKGDAPILNEFTEEDILENMASQLSNLEESIVSLISEIFWEPDGQSRYRIRLFMTDGQEVIASIRNFQEKMSVYPSIASQLDPTMAGVLYIDVGAYFQPFSQEKNDEQIEIDIEQSNDVSP